MSLTPQIPSVSATETIRFSISAFPQISNVHFTPEHYGAFGRVNWQQTLNIKRTYPKDNQKLIIEGTSLKFTDSVYLSTTNNVFVSSITGLSANSRYQTLSTLSALFPAFSGYNINNYTSGGTVAAGAFKILDDNHLEITLPKLENDGYMDIIILNGAGWNSLQNSLSTILKIYA